MRPCLPVLVLVGLLTAGSPGYAALSPRELSTVAAAPASDAVVPLDLPVTASEGGQRSLRDVLGGKPALLMLADYRCTQLCGSILAIAAQALRGSGLSPSADFTLAVVGFNPEANAADAATMRDAQLGGFPELDTAAQFLTGTPAAIQRLEQAIGFTAVRDQAAGRFAHPADLFVLTADGRVSRVLNGLSLDPATLRLALVEAGEGRVGSLIDRLHVLCYGLDPLSGVSTGAAQTMLRIGASLTLLSGGGFVLLALWRRRHPRGTRA